jgi:hypothetical protein
VDYLYSKHDIFASRAEEFLLIITIYKAGLLTPSDPQGFFPSSSWTLHISANSVGLCSKII